MSLRGIKTLLLLLTLLGCSRTIYTPSYTSLDNRFECPYETPHDRALSQQFWMQHRIPHFNRKNWEAYFQEFSDQLDTLNVHPIDEGSVSRYRMTSQPAFGIGESMTISQSGLQTVIEFGLLEGVVVRKVTALYPDSVWNDVDAAMDTLLWNQEAYTQTEYAYSDGTAYYFEGYRNGQYIMLFSGSASIEQHHKKLFELLSALNWSFQNMKRWTSTRKSPISTVVDTHS